MRRGQTSLSMVVDTAIIHMTISQFIFTRMPGSYDQLQQERHIVEHACAMVRPLWCISDYGM